MGSPAPAAQGWTWTSPGLRVLLPASSEGVLAVSIHFLNSKMHVFASSC